MGGKLAVGVLAAPRRDAVLRGRRGERVCECERVRGKRHVQKKAEKKRKRSGQGKVS